MKNSGEIKGAERVSNSGEFAAIRESLTPECITNPSAFSLIAVHDNNDSGYCRQRHFTTITHATRFFRAEIWRSLTAKCSRTDDASVSMHHRFKPLEFEGFGKCDSCHRIVGTPSPQSTCQASSTIVRSLTAQSPVPNANGVPPSSPGLRGTRYPGSSPRKTSQPQRGCGPCDAAFATPDGTALRFGSLVAHEPRVGLIAFGQPWAEGRKPVGLGISYANGVPTSSPGLRGTRYPGLLPRKTSQPQRGCGLAVSSRVLEAARTETLTALDGFLTGRGNLK